jgi:hypothetical protein
MVEGQKLLASVKHFDAFWRGWNSALKNRMREIGPWRVSFLGSHKRILKKIPDRLGMMIQQIRRR